MLLPPRFFPERESMYKCEWSIKLLLLLLPSCTRGEKELSVSAMFLPLYFMLFALLLCHSDTVKHF